MASGQCEDAEADPAMEHGFGAVRGRGSPAPPSEGAKRPHVADRRGRRLCARGRRGGAVVAESAPMPCVMAGAAVVAESAPKPCVMAGRGYLFL